MDHVLVSLEGGIATLVLNRPDRMNAFSDDMIFGLIDHLDALGSREDVGVILLTGAGRAFCAGGDVKAMAASSIDYDARVLALKEKHRLIKRLRSIPKPVVARVNGAAVGAGLALALACDFRLASSEARMGATYARVGLSGDFGITYSLCQLAGRAKAQELLYSGRIIDAPEALALGLVDEVFEPEHLVEATATFLERFLRGPRIAFGLMKQALAAADADVLDRVLDMEAENLIRAMMTADHREAAAAFVEKRAPVFTGR